MNWYLFVAKISYYKIKLYLIVFCLAAKKTEFEVLKAQKLSLIWFAWILNNINAQKLFLCY